MSTKKHEYVDAEAVADWPRYQCHKVVQAAKILGESRYPAEDEFSIELEGQRPIDVTGDWHRKHRPMAGGYLVRYEDGYLSYSPSVPFERGCTPVGDGIADPHAASPAPQADAQDPQPATQDLGQPTPD